MNYDKPTDKYLKNIAILYDYTQKDKFDEIFLTYGLTRVSDREYKCNVCDIKITSEEQYINVLPNNAKDFLENSFYVEFYNFMRFFVYFYYPQNKIEFSVNCYEFRISSLKGLIQFLDLLEFYKTDKAPVSIVKKESEDYIKRLTKY